MKYAIVGTGSRHQMYRDALAGPPVDTENELVALCDTNPDRLALSAASVPNRGNGVPTYDASEFDRMLVEQRPDRVIVTSPDYTHDDYIVRAMRGGCDVVTEKPMTTDLRKLKAIIDCQRETGRRIIVTFNYRFSPPHAQIKSLIHTGAIGRVTAVDLRWHLDRVHGADYFRRWHRYRKLSGGLLVHKSTHHFDMVNWWLNARPVTVSALGSRTFYTPATAEALGLAGHGERCNGCTVFDRCPYRLDIEADAELNRLYLQAEVSDGYHRDRCIFDASIDIEDTMQVQVGYSSGATLNYTLCAYSPWEGFEVIFYGTDGELVHRHVGVHGVFGGVRAEADSSATSTSIHLYGEGPQAVEVWLGKGDHGGADPIMLNHLLTPPATKDDRYGQFAGLTDGAWSIVTGLAAGESIGSGATVVVDHLLAREGVTL